jgi:hypothetical protein
MIDIVVVVAPHEIKIIFAITWQTKVIALVWKNMISEMCG